MFTAGKRFTLRSNASCRIYPALHVGLQRKSTQSCPYSRSERFTFAAGKRFTLRSNASRRIYPALHVGLQRKSTQSCPYSRSERFTFAAGKRFTLRSNTSRRIFDHKFADKFCPGGQETFPLRRIDEWIGTVGGFFAAAHLVQRIIVAEVVAN